MARTPDTKLVLIEAGIKRWKSRLQRAMTMVAKLERQKKRIEKAMMVAPRPRGHARISDPSTLGIAIQESIQDQLKPMTVEDVIASVPVEPGPDDLGIPHFLRRKKLDDVAKQMIVEQAETKKLKTRGRIEKMKAAKRGDLKKMPLSGKAALAAIDSE
jgi:hypothetical protein